MMRAISLHQPWASLMAMEIKLYETRGRLTHVTGDVAICSAMKKVPPESLSADLLNLLWSRRDEFGGCCGNVREILEQLPYGKVLCVTEFTDCLPTEFMGKKVSEIEFICGDYSPGRFAWITDDFKRRKLETPIQCKGKQGFFFLPPDVEQRVRAQL